MELKFYQCQTCGKIIMMIKDTGVPTVCCGQPMKELIPGTVDAAVEKHIPAVTIEGDKVTVVIGEVIHPMLEEHHIEWIAIQTKEGCQMKELHPGDEPKAVFMLAPGDEVIAAYEHCNIHGLWKY